MNVLFERTFFTIVLLVIPLYIILTCNLLDFKMNILKRFSDTNNTELVTKDEKQNVCKMPQLRVFDSSIIRYIKKEKTFNCSKIPPLVYSEENTLFVNQSILKQYNVTENASYMCSYQPFWRVEPKGNAVDHQIEYSNNTYYFNVSISVKEEFVKIVCKRNETEIYTDFQFFVPIKKNFTKRNTDDINIIIVGIDAVSRMNLHRQMPKTIEAINKLQAIEFKMYNKVGDNTFPNVLALMTGLHEKEIKDLCWKTSKTRLDNCPFLWKNFSGKGYVTSFAEEVSSIGAFQYVKRGFRKQPTDYYWQVGSFAAEKAIGHHKYGNTILCIGARPVYSSLLNYNLKFVKTMKDYKYFGFFWETSLTHDYINSPALGDTHYANFFNELLKSEALNNSLLIILSDHGMRYGGITKTYQGHLESRLPFLFIRPPEKFIKKYPKAAENLKINTERLATAFDVHETMKDILNISLLDENREENVYKRGVSLFLPVPQNRTCESAGIPENYCTCQTSVPVNKSSKTISTMANFTIKYINNLYKNYKICEVLQLDEIIEARKGLSAKQNDKSKDKHYDYTVSLRAKPSGAIFEAGIRCPNDCNNATEYELVGHIDRLNLYGTQSYCMDDTILKLYCYCL